MAITGLSLFSDLSPFLDLSPFSRFIAHISLCVSLLLCDTLDVTDFYLIGTSPRLLRKINQKMMHASPGSIMAHALDGASGNGSRLSGLSFGSGIGKSDGLFSLQFLFPLPAHHPPQALLTATDPLVLLRPQPSSVRSVSVAPPWYGLWEVPEVPLTCMR